MKAPLLLTLLCLGALFSPPTKAAQPNIIVILADDLGRADYSAYGTPDLRTPHIDRLFSEGITFENFRANSCVCSPTRAALLTGCHPDRVGVPGVIREETPENSWGYFAPLAPTLPEVLRASGYHTAIVGKWHLGTTPPNVPNERGFNSFRGFLGDMMDDYWTHLRNGQNFMRHNSEVIDPKGHATDLFTDWACDYIQERSRTKAPFFLYLAYNAPHDPVQPPPDWLEKVRLRQPGISDKRAALAALIEHMDEGIGKVMDTLKRSGQDRNTLVVFTSDNGGLLSSGANNGPWRSGKTHMYEGGLRVPCAARWPGHIPAGSRTSRNVLTMDWYPTLCEAAGARIPEGTDATTCLPVLLGKPQDETPRGQYFVRREGGPMYGGKTIEALISGEWKVVQDSPFAPLELYNLATDPAEQTELSRKEPGVFKELSAELRRQVQRGGQSPWQKR